MSRIYPNIDGEKKATNGTCLKCGLVLTPNNQGTTFNVEYSYMNGEDESETYCKQHAHEFRQEIQAIHKRVRDRQYADQRREVDHLASLYCRLAEKYEVKQFTPWQWRINGVLDVYPKSKAYHDIKRNKRGHYSDVFRLCQQIFSSPLSR